MSILSFIVDKVEFGVLYEEFLVLPKSTFIITIYNSLPNYQFEFQPHHSTTNQVGRMTTTIHQ